ncbi:HAMP domain-containing histidine kinase [Steroidobacter sp. S1-65]|uniref:histidine kinase n=1 Tax=Steroidobacter gossypii TaxID=2805490 RepID=A0ABS1WZP8_9GAMM|nr:HAMP domain-containing sensor histidine kinase [Steroidobacter gossypii]MBM0106427.1 HAMP domain-containing histidine kinase [Steroidobacter gossypii]
MTSGPSLVRQISVRLVAAAVIVSLIEIIGVLFLYSADHPKLAEEWVNAQSERIHAALTSGDASQLAQLDVPYGAEDWTFLVHDSKRHPRFQQDAKNAATFDPLPAPIDHDWTRIARDDSPIVLYGSRHLPNDAWLTIGVTGKSLPLFAPVFMREAYAHVIVPVAPVTILLLALNVFIVRRMLAPLSQAASEVDALDPSRMETRLSVPSTPREVRALVLAMNRALDRLAQAMQTLESFTADAAHEMRTPLSILKLRVEALEPGPAKNALREDVAAMTRLVNQMLDLAQADTLDAQLTQAVDLPTLARDVIERMLPVAVARGCDIELKNEGGGSIKGHAEALSRVLTNLIDNAIAHSPKNHSIDVVVGPGPRLIVRDRGPGFSRESAEHLFRRFWRGASPGRAGAGLGLAIAQSILSRHGATITADNAVDGGAVFTIQWIQESLS